MAWTMAAVGMNDKTEQRMRVWALLGPHRGDNNQVLALAEALGLPFEEKWLRFNQLRRLQPALLGATLKSVAADARSQLEGEPPDLTISTGHRSVPVVRALRKRSGGKMRAVHLGYPRISPAISTSLFRPPNIRCPMQRTSCGSPSHSARRGSSRQIPTERERSLRFPAPVGCSFSAGRRFTGSCPSDADDRVASCSCSELRARRRFGARDRQPAHPERPAGRGRRRARRPKVPTFIAPLEGTPSYPAMIEAADEFT